MAKKTKKIPSKAPIVLNDVESSFCKKCLSTERTGYTAVRHFDIAGVDSATGREFNRLTTKRTKCANCGQARLDRFREVIVKKKPVAKKEGSPRSRREAKKSSIRSK